MFGLVGLGFMAYQPLLVIYYQILFTYYIWFVNTKFVENIFKQAIILWHINHFRLFNAKSSLYIYIYIYIICERLVCR